MFADRQESIASWATKTLPRPVTLACLAVCALGLSQGGALLHARLALLRQDTARLAQEAVMGSDDALRALDLFSLTPGQRRSFRLTATAYCPLCGSEDGQPQVTALDGRRVRPGRTVAVSQDLRRLLGRKVYIEGLGLRVVEDLMHPRFTHRVDLCLPDREQALAFGVRRLDMVVLD